MLIGASILRVGFGIIILYSYSINYAQRHFLWGYNSISKTEFSDEFTNFSIYQYGSTNLHFEIIFHLGIIVALLFTLGYKTRLISFLNLIFLYSLHQENPTILDGGNNIMIIVLIYLMFVKTNAYFSIDKYSNQNKIKENVYINILHNFGVLAVTLQFCILYLNSALYKVMGEYWQNGTAIYYILQVDEFNLPWLTDLIVSSDILIVLMTYSTLLLQIAFPFMLLNKVTKYIALTLVVPLHLGIAFAMGLITFSFIMILIDTILISDEDYKKAYAFIKKKFVKKKETNQVQLETNSIEKFEFD
ncbi:HTTM domain-containing protein [Viridibacillus sp. NPDC093762]|uniref:HTTM domain-containing protein n=1 Tax=Viridibacillus sp. NPDC093762 TaxID=3390720 RepID=UPI003D063D5E